MPLDTPEFAGKQVGHWLILRDQAGEFRLEPCYRPSESPGDEARPSGLPAREVIREGVAQACRRYNTIKPYKIGKPVKMKLEVVSRGKMPIGRSDAKILDGRTFQVQGRTVEEALNRMT